MDKVLQTFEGLIRRSIAPSVTFFMVFVAGELIAVKCAGDSVSYALTSWISYLGKAFGKAQGLFTTMSVMVVIGAGYGLSAIQQILFDNRLKKNFDPRNVWLAHSLTSEARALQELRDQVNVRLDSEPWLERFQPIYERTDYVLYEILGGIDPTDTRPFVDTAKAIGIVFSSLIAVTAWNLAAHWYTLGWWAVVLVAMIGTFHWLGREATAAQYRARALRLYVNFLMMPTERLQRRLLRPDELTESDSGNKASGK